MKKGFLRKLSAQRKGRKKPPFLVFLSGILKIFIRSYGTAVNKYLSR